MVTIINDEYIHDKTEEHVTLYSLQCLLPLVDLLTCPQLVYLLCESLCVVRDLYSSRCGQVGGFFEYRMEPSSAVKCGEFPDQPNDWRLLSDSPSRGLLYVALTGALGVHGT